MSPALACSAWLALVAIPRTASAQDPVAVEVTGCEALLPEGALEVALGVELRGADEHVNSYIVRVHPHARVRCENGEIIVELLDGDGVTYSEAASEIRLGLPRFLAIAIVEALTANASRPEPEAETPPPDPVPREAPPPAIVPAARTYAWLSVAGGAQWGGTPAWWRGHAAVRVDVAATSLWTLHGGFGLSKGSLSTSLGTIQGIETTLHLGARVGTTRGAFRIEAGPGLRGGLVVWNGRAREDSGFSGMHGVAPWLGAMLDVQLGVALGPSVRLSFFVECGVPIASASATASGVTYARLGPTWLLFGASVALRLLP